ncbi:prenyltransferase [Thermoflexus sp.]|uniref:prenyltransferase n=1 Tax=Thermoflexus sp. TaxID=1969742 RepID=UPI0025DBC82B|nr:prenyltransferase [Thermoflexus sp.]MDW8180247.1 prenyltransferase [Anaerolineae bacterium]MCS6963764.1 prenyltransferase [Thermoflexus sp.]MCS7350796.1 prenyltransferase [Thermoflexus sp.]MCX7691618.1 prenyltransferase [Thermoflexus sp.]MDW8183814.1 prenyltransferase [Anaerolineae bacterium]
MWRNWLEVYRTCNLSADRPMDPVSKWLLIVRCCVFPMTLISAAIGGLLAAAAGRFELGPFALSTMGLLLAHAANNMINDYFDLETGLDTAEYVRAQYAPHPVLSGLVTRPQLLRAILLVNVLDAGIALYLTALRGWPILAFVLAGLFISVFYVAPPIRLKRIGLGELGVFLVWGPLMIGGTFYATTGTLPPWVWLASLPYALLVATVLIGKHIDKLEQDRARGIYTLPVLLGEPTARALNIGMMIAFYVVVLGLALTRVLGPWVLLTLFSLPRLREVIRTYTRPRPPAPPPNYPVWPLWYVSWAFLFNRRAGALFLVGLLLNLVFPIPLPGGFIEGLF